MPCLCSMERAGWYGDGTMSRARTRLRKRSKRRGDSSVELETACPQAVGKSDLSLRHEGVPAPINISAPPDRFQWTRRRSHLQDSRHSGILLREEYAWRVRSGPRYVIAKPTSRFSIA